MALQVLVASDHSIIRDAVVQLLRAQPSIRPTGDSLSEPSGRGHHAALILCIVDTRPDVSGVLEELHQKYAGVPVLCLLLGQEDAAVISALRAGVRGVIDDTFSADQLTESIHQCVEGQFVMSKSLATRLAQQYAIGHAVPPAVAPEADLTHREAEVLTLLGEGRTNREIAARLCVSEHTVRAHLRAIMQKLQVTNRVQAATVAWQTKLSRKEPAREGVEHANPGR